MKPKSTYFVGKRKATAFIIKLMETFVQKISAAIKFGMQNDLKICYDLYITPEK